MNKETLDWANSRGVGQFHIMVRGQYHSTWHSYGTAMVTARKVGGIAYNDSGERLPLGERRD
jgi:hypothetical protein